MDSGISNEQTRKRGLISYEQIHKHGRWDHYPRSVKQRKERCGV